MNAPPSDQDPEPASTSLRPSAARDVPNLYRPPNRVQALAYHAIKNSVRAMFKVYCRSRVEGGEHLPASGACLILANHASMLDPPLVSSHMRPAIHFLARTGITTAPFIGPLVTSVLNTHPIRRGGVDREAIKLCVDILAADQILLLFPEGTRSPDGRLSAPRGGFAMIVEQLPGLRCLPVIISGSHRVLGRGRYVPRPRKVVIRVGVPFAFEPKVEGEARREYFDRCAARLKGEWETLGGIESQTP